MNTIGPTKYTTLRVPVMIHRKLKRRAEQQDTKLEKVVAALLTRALETQAFLEAK